MTGRRGESSATRPTPDKEGTPTPMPPGSPSRCCALGEFGHLSWTFTGAAVFWHITSRGQGHIVSRGQTDR